MNSVFLKKAANNAIKREKSVYKSINAILFRKTAIAEKINA